MNSWIFLFATIYYFRNAEMTSELYDDLINFSFNNLQDALKDTQVSKMPYSIFAFTPGFLADLRKLVCYCFHSCIL
jgi:hypothetical protein